MKYAYTITEETMTDTKCQSWVLYAYSDRARAIAQFNALEAQEKALGSVIRYPEWNSRGERKIVIQIRHGIKKYYLQKTQLR